jgi:DNA-binding IscR family transcriptional regulator
MLQDILSDEEFISTLADAVSELISDVHCTGRGRNTDWRRFDRLQDIGVTLDDGLYGEILTHLDKGPETEKFALAKEYTASIGQGVVSVGGRYLTLDGAIDCDLEQGPLAVFDSASPAPSIDIVVTDEFQDRNDIEKTIKLILTLSSACDIRVVGSGLMIRWLYDKYRDLLPAEFSEWIDSHSETGPPVDAQVDEALSDLSPDSRAVDILRMIASEPSETLSLHSIQQSQQVTDGRVSHILGELEELGLIGRWGPRTDKSVELRPAGASYLEYLDAEIGRQRELENTISEQRQSHNRTCNQKFGRGPDSAPSPDEQTTSDQSHPYRTRFLAPHQHIASVTSATDGRITTCTDQIESSTTPAERHTRYVSFDSDRDEAVIAYYATSPLQCITSLALGLASPRFLDKALPTDRLDQIDESPVSLRYNRCIGGLSTEATEDPAVLRESLIEWGEAIEDMTRKLKTNECTDRDSLCREIVKSAHGLAGSVTHLLDTANISLVREVRVPQSLSNSQLRDLSTTIATATAIQSKYGSYSVYRQILEDRVEKQQQTPQAIVDMDDPSGTLIGGWVIRGGAAERFVEPCSGVFPTLQTSDDAPPITLPVHIEAVDRSAVAECVTRMCKSKGLSPTPDAISLFHTFVSTPYSTADALNRLNPEDNSRSIRLDEVRTSLALVETEKICPSEPQSVSQILSTLLGSPEPLSRSEIADISGISKKSVDRYISPLQALDMVRASDLGGYEVSLPSSPEKEQSGPQYLSDHLRPRDAACNLLTELVDDPKKLSDPTDIIGKNLLWPPDIGSLADESPLFADWYRLLVCLCGGSDTTPAPVQACLGSHPSQQSLSEYRVG